jgi:hypothetical protein
MFKFRNVLLMSFLALAVGCGGPPQLGPDREAFKAVDALYTAVSLRDAGLVAGCAGEFRRLREAGQLPVAAARELEMIVDQTGQGDWETARERLGHFMKGQRRRKPGA